MRRLLALAALAGIATIGSSIPAGAAGQTCGNSYPADGHNGPWRTTNNGGTLHGNTVHVDCPGPNVHWDVTYRVQGAEGGVWVTELVFTRSGNGTPPDFSGSISPYACDTVHVYRTHVDNTITGGSINKPAGGGGVHLAC